MTAGDRTPSEPREGALANGALPRTPGSTGWWSWYRPRVGIAIGITACSRLTAPRVPQGPPAQVSWLPMARPVHDAPLPAATEGRDAPAAPPRPHAGYLWAMLLART